MEGKCNGNTRRISNPELYVCVRELEKFFLSTCESVLIKIPFSSFFMIFFFAVTLLNILHKSSSIHFTSATRKTKNFYCKVDFSC